MFRSARSIALAGALAVHAAAAGALVLLAGPAEPPPSLEPRSLDVVLVIAPEPLAPQSTPEPAAPAEAGPQPAEPLVQSSEDVPETLAEPDPKPEPEQERPAQAEQGGQTLEVLAAPGGEGAAAVIFERPAGQGGALRGVACAGAGQAMRAALGCEAASGLDLTAYAGAGAVDAVAARFTLDGPAPPPQSWLMLGFQPRPGSLMAAADPRLAASDSLRDRLPPSDPDPAFGD